MIPRLAVRLAPVAFVLIWSSGFIVARAVAPVAAPNLFLGTRFAVTALLFGGLALAARVAWPRGRAVLHHLGAGGLQQGLYLGAGYWAVANGMAAGVMALMGALQPLLSAALAGPLLGERAGRGTWAGLGIGLLGVALVLAPKLAAVDGISTMTLLAGCLSIAAVTAGSLVQKMGLAAVDLRASVAVQNLGGALVCGLGALLLGETLFLPGPVLWGNLAYAVLVLSAGGATIFVWLLRRGDAAKATALIYLCPPLAAVQGYVLFGETLTALQLLGFGIALAGTVLARR